MNQDDRGQWKDFINEELAKSARLGIYTAVTVLLLYWERDEKGFKDEGLRIGQMFETTFNYAVEKFEIPLSDSYLRLHQFITQTALALSTSAKETRGSSLLIIHYGGHGDRNDRIHEGEFKRAVWSSNMNGTVLLPWFKLQEDLENLEIDLLLLFDCCFAAQAGRGLDHPGRSELLAAAAMGMMTPKPGEKSFTTALEREILASYEENGGFVIIKDVHARLVRLKARLYATPVHVNLRPGRRSIRLEPLSKSPPSDANERSDGTFIPLVLRTREDLGRLNMDMFVQWLGEDRPQTIASVRIFEATSQIQEFMQSVEKKQSPLAKAVNDISLDSILKAWDNVLSLVEQCTSLRHRSGHDVSVLRSRARDLLQRLDAMNHEFVDTLERSVITVNNSRDRQVMDDAINDPIAKSLGIIDTLKLHQIIYSTDNAQRDLLEDEGTIPSLSRLKEEKRYDGYFNEQEMEELRVRIRHLAVLLSAPKDPGFQSLRCYRCEHSVFERRYILHFEVPPAYDVTTNEPLTLMTVIEKIKGAARPTLDERLRMALLLAKAVHKWHSAGWVHQGISSPNIRLLRFKDGGHIDFSQPFLLGFDFARPDSDPSLGRPVNDLYFDVYRHPTRQGPARRGHRRIHDYYSLGVVLLEIGLWQSAVKMVTKVGERLNPHVIQNVLQRDCSERLSHYSGILYQEAVDRCLHSRFDVKLDDENESQLLNQFHKHVVNKLARGVMIY